METVASIMKEKDCTMKIKNKELKDKYSEKLEQKLCNLTTVNNPELVQVQAKNQSQITFRNLKLTYD